MLRNSGAHAVVDGQVGHAAESSRAPRRFLIVDSHDPVRRSLVRLVECRPDWSVVGEAVGADEGLRLAQATRPHVAIVDPCLRKSDGLELTQTLAALAPDIRIVGFSFQDDCRSVSRFLEAGGHGFVSKHEPSQALVQAIEQALAGRIRVAFRDASAMSEEAMSEERREPQSST